MQDIHDIKGLVPLPHDLWWLLLLLIFAAVAAAVYWMWKRKQPGAWKPVVPPPTPYEIAMRALQQLLEENPPVEEFYTRLSDIVRHYLEGQLGLRAPERTTEEFLYEMSQDRALSPEHKELLSAFLQESDLVKFARFRPGESDKKRVYDAAERFVRDTQPRVQEEAVAPA